MMGGIKLDANKLINIALLTGAGVGTFFLMRKMVRESAKTDVESKILSDPDAGLADKLYLLLHPLQGGWASPFENVDEEAVIKWALNPMDFNKVRSYYKKITKSNDLMDDVKGALNDNEYIRFTDNLKKSDQIRKTTNVDPAKPKKLIAKPAGAVKKVYSEIAYKDPKQGWTVRSDAKITYHTTGSIIGELMYPMSIKRNGFTNPIKYFLFKNKAGVPEIVLQSQVTLKD